MVRVVGDTFRFGIDSSGDPLHLRGWRLETAKMPMRESIAAGILRRSGWDGVAPLVDPCCGAGTLAIEAALQACGAPPHDAATRPFSFQQWPQPRFEPGTWASVLHQAGVKAEAARERAAAADPFIVAADRDAGAVRAARENAARAGVERLIEFRTASLSDVRRPAGGNAVCTPAPPLLPPSRDGSPRIASVCSHCLPLARPACHAHDRTSALRRRSSSAASSSPTCHGGYARGVKMTCATFTPRWATPRARGCPAGGWPFL